MNSILKLELLLPIGLLILQSFVFLFICVAVLKKSGILKMPYAGMEYSQVIVAGTFLFAVFFISIADTEAIFQSFKTFQNAKENIVANTFYKFCQFFCIVLFFEILFVLVSIFIIKLLLGFKNSIKEIQEGNIPAGVLTGVIVLSFSIIIKFSAQEIIEYAIPQYLNFR